MSVMLVVLTVKCGTSYSGLKSAMEWYKICLGQLAYSNRISYIHQLSIVGHDNQFKEKTAAEFSQTIEMV
jgi:hypothetical protein